jgi:hypothetical protein
MSEAGIFHTLLARSTLSPGLGHDDNLVATTVLLLEIRGSALVAVGFILDILLARGTLLLHRRSLFGIGGVAITLGGLLLLLGRSLTSLMPWC